MQSSSQQQQQQGEQSAKKEIPPMRMGVSVSAVVGNGSIAALMESSPVAKRRLRWTVKPPRERRQEKLDDARAEKNARKATNARRRHEEDEKSVTRPLDPMPCNAREMPQEGWATLGYAADAQPASPDGASETTPPLLHLHWRSVVGRGIRGNPLVPLPIGPEDKLALVRSCADQDSAELASWWFSPVLVHAPLLYLLLDQFPRRELCCMDAVVPAPRVFHFYRMAMRYMASLFHQAEGGDDNGGKEEKEKGKEAAPEATATEDKPLTEEQQKLKASVERNYQIAKSENMAAVERFEKDLIPRTVQELQDSLLRVRSLLGASAREALSREATVRGARAWLEDAKEKDARESVLLALQYVTLGNTMAVLHSLELTLCRMLSIDPSLVKLLSTPWRTAPGSAVRPRVRISLRRYAGDSIRAYGAMLEGGADAVIRAGGGDAEVTAIAEEGRFLGECHARLFPSDEAAAMLAPTANDGVSPLDWYLARFGAWSRLRDLRADAPASVASQEDVVAK
jgi:hypothetical protein